VVCEATPLRCEARPPQSHGLTVAAAADKPPCVLITLSCHTFATFQPLLLICIKHLLITNADRDTHRLGCCWGKRSNTPFQFTLKSECVTSCWMYNLSRCCMKIKESSRLFSLLLSIIVCRSYSFL